MQAIKESWCKILGLSQGLDWTDPVQFVSNSGMVMVLIICFVLAVFVGAALYVAWHSVPDPVFKLNKPSGAGSISGNIGASGSSIADLQKRFATPEYPIFTTEFDVEVQAETLWSELKFEKQPINGSWTSLYRERTGIEPPALDLSPVSLPGQTLITLLVDHSGSMRGERMKEAASAVAAACEIFDAAGFNTEILGFTTRSWRGGEARKLWQRQGKPAFPGRLCDLLHIVYKAADQTFHLAKADLQLMVHGELLRENIDGEALLWAKSRFENSETDRWLCIVISDGAPVDDSTLSCNVGSLFFNHLKSVIKEIASDSRISLAGFGLGYTVSELYAASDWAEPETPILPKLVALVERALRN